MHALVLGKFYPPHAGHSFLIERALSKCERVTVMLIGKAADEIPVGLRHQWLAELHPSASVLSGTAEHPIDFDNAAVWDLWIDEIRMLCPDKFDMVFSSEGYGEELARRLGAEHVCVDLGRVAKPVSGTAIRNDIAANWQYLSPPVRSHLAQRVVLVGAESTGTTTMTKALADHFGTLWVPEYGREYTYEKADREGRDAPWRSDEFEYIAQRQNEMEDDAAGQCPIPLLFCDTDAFATSIWHEFYMGSINPNVEALGFVHPRALYLLTIDDIPFEADGWRDGEHRRNWMTQRFRDEMNARDIAFVELHGNHEDRFVVACNAVNNITCRSIDHGAPRYSRSRQNTR